MDDSEYRKDLIERLNSSARAGGSRRYVFVDVGILLEAAETLDKSIDLETYEEARIGWGEALDEVESLRP